MRRVFAQLRKELTQIGRDRLALVLALVLPLCLLMLLGSAVSLTVTGLPVVVQDLDDTPASRDFIDAFRASLTFHIVAWPSGRQPAEAFLTNTARAALVILEHFGRDMARGMNTEVQLLVDGTDANTAKLVQGYASQVVSNYRPTPASVKADIRLWFNPGRDAKKFYAPGSFVMGLSMFPALLAALAMSKEGEQKTILQVYVSSISAHEFLLGKILAFALIAMAEWFLSLIVLLTYFGLHFAGDPSVFIVATILYALCVAAFGSLVGAAIPSQAAAIQVIALGGFLLTFLLSGLIFPVENIPASLRWISGLVWSRYYIEIVRDALLRGGGWPAMWFNVVMIAVIGGVFYALGWKKLRRMQLSV